MKIHIITTQWTVCPQVAGPLLKTLPLSRQCYYESCVAIATLLYKGVVACNCLIVFSLDISWAWGVSQVTTIANSNTLFSAWQINCTNISIWNWFPRIEVLSWCNYHYYKYYNSEGLLIAKWLMLNIDSNIDE